MNQVEQLLRHKAAAVSAKKEKRRTRKGRRWQVMLMPKSKLVEGEDIVVEGLRRTILIPTLALEKQFDQMPGLTAAVSASAGVRPC